MNHTRTLLLMNPASGQGAAGRNKKKLLAFVSDAPNIDTFVSQAKGDLAKKASRAVSDGYDQIIAAGGDGTVNEVINGIGDQNIPLGLIPLGTANVLAREMGIPHNSYAQALAIIFKGKMRKIDIGRANGRVFALMAGFGFDAEVVDSVSTEVKDVLGPMAYASAGVSQLITYNPSKFRLTLDGSEVHEITAYAVIVANCASYAYNFKIAREALLDDGMLDITVFKEGFGAKLAFLGGVTEMLFQQKHPDTNTTFFRASSIKIEATPEVKMQLDGDVWGESPCIIDVKEKALSVFVP